MGLWVLLDSEFEFRPVGVQSAPPPPTPFQSCLGEASEKEVPCNRPSRTPEDVFSGQDLRTTQRCRGVQDSRWKARTRFKHVFRAWVCFSCCSVLDLLPKAVCYSSPLPLLSVALSPSPLLLPRVVHNCLYCIEMIVPLVSKDESPNSWTSDPVYPLPLESGYTSVHTVAQVEFGGLWSLDWV